ncbi:MAG: P27 family phage terminase small subunit [Nitrospirae bacterium]|nr:P27 family phage terminase small subunit [Nitrospirota bacterium]
MGRGRKPKPTALKVLQGNPGKRKLNTDEPEYAIGAPDKPDWLDQYASAEWDRLSAVMLEGRLLTKADWGILLSTCLAYSQMHRNELALQRYKSDSYIVVDQLGNRIPKSRPETIRKEVARRQYVSFLAEMGQTTVSKTKVKRIPNPTMAGVKRLLG